MSKNTIFRKKNIQSVLSQSEDGHSSGLVKVLGVRDLTSFGIAAIIGAGIFSTIGRASFEGGPAVSLLFVFVSPIYAQVGGQSVYQFLNLVQSPRQAALGGKTVTIVYGFEGALDAMNDLGKALKNHCGTGGSVKDGEIIIQGDHRQKIFQYLKQKGYAKAKL